MCAVVHSERDTIVLEISAETRQLADRLAVEAGAQPGARGRRMRIVESYERIIAAGVEALRGRA